MHAREIADNEVDAFLQRDPEARHARVGDRQRGRVLGDQLLEEGDDRAARADHIAVAHDREARLLVAHHVVCRDEELVGGEFRRPVEIDRVRCLVGRERHHLFDACRDRRLDDVLGAMDVRLDTFHGVVFGGRHLLQRGGMDHEIDAPHRLLQAFGVAHIADEIAHLRRVELLRHFILLELVAREDDDAARLVPLDQRAGEFAAEGARAPRYQDGFILEHPVSTLGCVPDSCHGNPNGALTMIARQGGNRRKMQASALPGRVRLFP